MCRTAWTGFSPPRHLIDNLRETWRLIVSGLSSFLVRLWSVAGDPARDALYYSVF